MARARTSTPAYPTVHGWIHKDRGPASDWKCHADGHDHYGETWAYSGQAENELRGISYSRGRYAYEYAYSANTSDYIPLCREAHNRLDAIHRNAALLQEVDDAGLWLL